MSLLILSPSAASDKPYEKAFDKSYTTCFNSLSTEYCISRKHHRKTLEYICTTIKKYLFLPLRTGVSFLGFPSHPGYRYCEAFVVSSRRNFFPQSRLSRLWVYTNFVHNWDAKKARMWCGQWNKNQAPWQCIKCLRQKENTSRFRLAFGDSDIQQCSSSKIQTFSFYTQFLTFPTLANTKTANASQFGSSSKEKVK